MARCEDFPCCGHESGCCPDYDASGRQLNMVCVCGAKLPVDAPYSICGAKLPVDAPYSICHHCMKQGNDEEAMSIAWNDSDYSEPDTNDDDDETPLYHDYYGGE